MSADGYPRNDADFRWPDEGERRLPDWLFTSDEIYRREVERIFRGPVWNYVGLAAEIPNAGDYRIGHVGPSPVVVARGEKGETSVFENRCAHRGSEICQTMQGHVKEFMCPYHQWLYDLKGNLISVPFRRGYRNQGGMPADFKVTEHNLRQLRVATFHGLIFASYSDVPPPLEAYLGEDVCAALAAVFAKRQPEVIGRWEQALNTNWKLYQENTRDSYHASLLHSFFVNFGLYRADQVAMQYVNGPHALLCVVRAGADLNADAGEEMRSYNATLKLQDDRFLGFTKEHDTRWTVVIHSIFPNLAIIQAANVLAMRELVPTGPGTMDLNWTILGFTDDDAATRKHRLHQANLYGPAGFASVDDQEVLDYVVRGLNGATPSKAVLELGGSDRETTAQLMNEAPIRGLYHFYRQIMDL